MVKSIGVACGREHTLVWTTEGQVFACGPGYGGRLGLGASNKDVLYPTCVTNGNDLEVSQRLPCNSRRMQLPRTHSSVSLLAKSAVSQLAYVCLACRARLLLRLRLGTSTSSSCARQRGTCTPR